MSSEESANKNNYNDEHEASTLQPFLFALYLVMRIEAEKYFEDAVPQCGTIPGTPDIISNAKGKIADKYIA